MSTRAELEPEVVSTRSGAPAIRDAVSGEVMHPVVGPLVEASALYVEPARLTTRLVTEVEAGPLVLLDVGLGAASNAIAAWRASESIAVPVAQRRRLTILSFDRSLAALELASRNEHASAFALDGAAGAAVRALLVDGAHETERTTWRFVAGDLPATLAAVASVSADVVFWDPFSPKANPGLWTVGAFRALFSKCRRGATLHTYSASTKTRAALLLAGFRVGIGPSTGEKAETTTAGTDGAELARPLDARWLARFQRSSDPLPTDATADAMQRVAEAVGRLLGGA